MAKKDPNKSIKDEKNKRNNKGGGKMRTADFRDANKNGVDDRDEGKKPKRRRIKYTYGIYTGNY